jgi:uncharacterized membrane protein
MWDRIAFKCNARSYFKQNYWPCVAVSVLLVLLSGGGSGLGYRFQHSGSSDWSQVFANGDPAGAVAYAGILAALAAVGITLAVVGLAVKLLIGNPFQVGAARFYMENRQEAVSFGTVKAGFTGNFLNVALTQFLKDLFIFLWSLLLFIPGVVKSLAYFAVPYILAENPDIEPTQALDLSKAMTYGHKCDIFVTGLSFIGWYLVAGITAGIAGIFYVSPYVDATNAEMYEFLREQALVNGVATADILPGFGGASFEATDNF